jgi:hypothetical protein
LVIGIAITACEIVMKSHPRLPRFRELVPNRSMLKMSMVCKTICAAELPHRFNFKIG